MNKNDILKSIQAFLCILAILFFYGCSSSSKTDSPWNVSDKDIVLSKSQAAQSIKVNIYIDATTSMGGFAANPDSIYNTFLNDIEGSIIAGWKDANISFFKFGTKVKELNREQFRSFNNQHFYSEAGIFEKTNIDKVIETMDNTQINIVVTDLFQNDGDVNSMIRSIKEGCFSKDIYLGIAGIKSDFNGKVYDAKVPPFSFKSKKDDEESYRPFYVLFFGEKNNIERLFAQMKDKKYVKAENFILISKYIVNRFGVTSMAKDKTAKNINLQGSSTDNKGNKQFDFVMKKEANEEHVIAEISFEMIPTAPMFSEKKLNIVAYKKNVSGVQSGKSNDKGENTNDITLKEAKLHGANKLEIKLGISNGDPTGNYSYLIYLQPGNVDGYVIPKWVIDFSSDNPTQKNDANKTLNLSRFIAGLLNANAAVSQPKIAQMIVNLKKL